MYKEIFENSVENDYIDFKREWYKNDKIGTVDMVHDILCMSNSLTDSPERYIVIGIDEDSATHEKTIYSVANDANCRKSANIIQTLRNYMSVLPRIEIIREQIDNDYIDIIKITPLTRFLPYVLSKSCEAQDKNNKKVSVKKEWIYTRNSDRNTPKDECCTRAELEEIFARKRGEHLPILERFSIYLNDLKNWKHPKSEYEISESQTAYYYLLNHKFKIVRSNPELDVLLNLSTAGSYEELVSDTALCEEYWKYRETQNCCYDDSIRLYNVELWADNTLIEVVNITEIFLKHFKSDRYHGTFYIPSPHQFFDEGNRVANSDDVEKLLIWKVCRLLFYFNDENNPDFMIEDSSRILEVLNYDYLKAPEEYRKQNEDWFYEPLTTDLSP